jgi:hypothetical protein
VAADKDGGDAAAAGTSAAAAAAGAAAAEPEPAPEPEPLKVEPELAELAAQALASSKEWLDKARAFMAQGSGRVAELDAIMLEGQQCAAAARLLLLELAAGACCCWSMLHACVPRALGPARLCRRPGR